MKPWLKGLMTFPKVNADKTLPMGGKFMFKKMGVNSLDFCYLLIEIIH